MIIKATLTATDGKILSIPHGRKLKIYGITILDQSGATNTIHLHDKGNYYDGVDFSNTYDTDVAVEVVDANASKDVKFEEPREVMNELWGVATGSAEVIINADYE